MKNAKTIEKATNKLLSLIEQYNQQDNKEAADEAINILSEEIEKIFHQGKINIEDILTIMVEKVDNIEDIMLFKSICEDISSILYIHGASDNVFEASLFIVPIIYLAKEGDELKQINRTNPVYGKLAKTFKKSGLFPKESDVYLHNHIYHPHELLNTNYNDIFKMTESLAEYIIMDNRELKNLNPSPYEGPHITNTTFMVKYMLGMKVCNKEEFELSPEQEEIAFEKFVKLSQPLISKLLNLEDYNVLLVENFYKGFQTGLDVYLSSARRLKITEALQEHEISPRGVKAIINLEDAETQHSNIELISKLATDTLCYINFETFNFHTAEESLAMIASDLEATGFKSEDIFVKWEKKIIPFLALLENTKSLPVDINEFMISTSKKSTLH